jgi:hypothetical protein
MGAGPPHGLTARRGAARRGAARQARRAEVIQAMESAIGSIVDGAAALVAYPVAKPTLRHEPIIAPKCSTAASCLLF